MTAPCRHQDDCAERRSCEGRRCARTLAARCVQLLNTDPEPRTDRALIAHVPREIDLHLAAEKLNAAASRQGKRVWITHKAKRGYPGQTVPVIKVEDMGHNVLVTGAPR